MKDLKKFSEDLKLEFLTIMTNQDLSLMLEHLCYSLDILRKYQSSPFDSEVSYNMMMLQIAIFKEMRHRLSSPLNNND